MAFSKKVKRRIMRDGQEFFWTASGDDGWSNLRVMVDINGGQQLHCMFDYHHDQNPIGTSEDRQLSNQFVVTPYIVRQVIEYGLSRGWTPLSGRGELRLGHVDDKIDLRFDKNRADAIRKAASVETEAAPRPDRLRQRLAEGRRDYPGQTTGAKR